MIKLPFLALQERFREFKGFVNENPGGRTYNGVILVIEDVLVSSVIFIVSLLALSKGAEVVISNGVKLARFFRISELAVGIVFISAATTLPELAVTLSAGSANEGGLAVGNAVGSVIFNIGVILGICMVLAPAPITIKKDEFKEVFNSLFIISAIAILLLLRKGLGVIEGIILLIIFFLYTYHIIRKKRVIENEKEEEVGIKEAGTSFLLFGVGIAVVLISANFVVDSAIRLADIFGLAKTFVGATIIAMGTSLPELTTEITAIRRGHIELALGNLFGSCMNCLTLILGLVPLVGTVSIIYITVFETILVFALLINLSLIYMLERAKNLYKGEGFFLLTLYLLFLLITSGVHIAYPGV